MPGRRRAGDANPGLQFLTIEELEAVIRAIPDELVVRAPATSRRGRPGPAPPPPPEFIADRTIMADSASVCPAVHSPRDSLHHTCEFWGAVTWPVPGHRDNNPVLQLTNRRAVGFHGQSYARGIASLEVRNWQEGSER